MTVMTLSANNMKYSACPSLGSCDYGITIGVGVGNNVTIFTLAHHLTVQQVKQICRPMYEHTISAYRL